MPPRRPDPLALAAVLLVAAGAGMLAWSRREMVPEEQRAPDQALVTPGSLPVPVPSARPALSDETACRGVGYLCSELLVGGRVRIQRWRDLEGPLVVHLPEPQMADRGLAQRLHRAASSGIRAWNGQPFPILVDERGTRDAHVEVRWVQRLSGAQIGLATVTWSTQVGLRVRSLELTTQYPWGAPMDPDQVRLVAAHEMGHALGLPHSDDSRDVMYPTNTATSLSARDYRTVEALYQLEDGTEIVSARRR